MYKKYKSNIYIKNTRKKINTEVHIIFVPVECQGYAGQQTDRKSK